jgi:hypothetical protein
MPWEGAHAGGPACRACDQALSLLRKDKEEALELLRKHCAELESRSDDDMIIGRLQVPPPTPTLRCPEGPRV